jgi:hypothetical protein
VRGTDEFIPDCECDPEASAILERVDRGKLLAFIADARDRATESFRAAAKRSVWRSAAFDFVRRIRFSEVFKDLRAETAAEIVEWAAREILGPGPEFLWEEFLGDSDTRGGIGDPYTDFLRCWDKIKGPGQLADALKAVQANPPADGDFGQAATGTRNARYRAFLALVEELAERRGETVLPLAVKPIGEGFGRSPSTVSGWLGRAVGHRFLDPVSEGRRGHAAEYEWLGRGTQMGNGSPAT